MCVIIIKPRGVEMPPKYELKRAAMHNPHGFGFVSSGGVYMRTMDFDSFYKEVKKVGKDECCIMHLRIATHGSHKMDNCHPFKKGDIYFAHNGVLDIRPHGDMTDSETAFQDILYPAAVEHGLGSPEFSLVVKRIIGRSKFAFMQGGHIWMFGRFIEFNGLYYSNLYHHYAYAF